MVTVPAALGRLGLLLTLALAACAEDLPPAPAAPPSTDATTYKIGPGDTLQVFVWRNQELSVTVPVRPDGRISIPLIEDVDTTDKTPTELGHELEERLKRYVAEPVVTVIVNNFVGPITQQVRIVGEATHPHALPYRRSMTALDAMIDVGGLTPFASGNRARLIRTVDGKETSFALRLDDLMKDGDIAANVDLRPGDIIIIPESYF